jgi:glycerophosphoryl diester phosphodiesterase
MARPDDILTSFYWPSMDHVRKTHPNVATGLLIDPSGSLDGGLDHADQMGHLTVNPYWSLVLEKPASIEEARRRGLQVFVWTVNDWAIAGELASFGVDGIITDDPGGLRDALDSL